MASMEMMREYLDLVTAGEFEAATDFWADDIVGHYSGQGLQSGTFRGKEAMVASMVQGLGKLDSVQVQEHDLLVSDDHAVVLTTGQMEKGEKHVDYKTAVVFHTEGDKITELWLMYEDQHAMDEFMS